jgi:hypothetical protein
LTSRAISSAVASSSVRLSLGTRKVLPLSLFRTRAAIYHVHAPGAATLGVITMGLPP